MTAPTISGAQAEEALRHLALNYPEVAHALAGVSPPPPGAGASFDLQGLLGQLPTFLDRAQAFLQALEAAGVIPARPG